MGSAPSSEVNLSGLDTRVYVRKLRSAGVALLLIGFYAQTIGVPDVGWPGERPLLRLSRPERPVWSYAWSAVAFVCSEGWELITEDAS